jgi:arginyl-tRNA synthetase
LVFHEGYLYAADAENSLVRAEEGSLLKLMKEFPRMIKDCFRKDFQK